MGFVQVKNKTRILTGIFVPSNYPDFPEAFPGNFRTYVPPFPKFSVFLVEWRAPWESNLQSFHTLLNFLWVYMR